jgi:hypothetical protein
MECSCDPVEVKKRQGGGLAALAEMFPDLNPNASSEENDRAGT